MNEKPKLEEDKDSTNLPVEVELKKEEQEKLTGWKKWLFIIIAILSGIYIFFPEFTDAFPIIGWIDEGIAVLIFTYALNKLGVRLPIIDALLKRKVKKKKE